MIKTKITFKVKDEAYFSMLKSYIALHYSEMITIEETDYDYVISDGERKEANYIIVSDTQFDIYKYQKASKICSLMMNMTNKEGVLPLYVEKNNRAKIITVTSAIGGAGKTSLSQKLCIELAGNHKKVLYLSLDSFSASDGIFCDEQENDLSKLMYYLSLKREVNQSIEAVKAYDHQKNVYFIRSIYPSMDGFMDNETVTFFLEGLKSNSIYHYIIFDLPSFLTPENIKMMNSSLITAVIKKHDTKREDIYLKFLAKKVESQIIIVDKPDCTDIVIKALSEQRNG